MIDTKEQLVLEQILLIRLDILMHRVNRIEQRLTQRESESASPPMSAVDAGACIADMSTRIEFIEQHLVMNQPTAAAADALHLSDRNAAINSDESFLKAMRGMTPAKQEEDLRQWLISEHYRRLPARDGRLLDVDPMVPEPTSRPLHEAQRIYRLGPFAPTRRRGSP